MKHSGEFHNEPAQKTNANSLRRKKRLILKAVSSKLVIRFEFSGRTSWLLMCLEAVLSLKIQLKTDFSQKCFSKEGVGGNEEE